ncbi:MAG: asparaginase [Chloroflexota bacterium]
MTYQPVIEVLRGELVESLHYGAVAVADGQGRLHAWWGDPKTVTFLRSTAKPFQALPLLESGSAERFQITERQLALICGSHSGTDEQVRAVEELQAQVGVSEADLQCGVHPPADAETARRLRQAWLEPTPNRNNCSGKHTGMLALACGLGAPLENYLTPDHPVQQRILEAVAEMCDLDPTGVGVAVDGCSAPTFALPLLAAATGYARLADSSGLSPARASACRRVFAAMTAHPDMVGGPGRFDTVLMQAAGGRILSKSGAEGYHGVAIAPGALGRGSPALGLALKIADGDQGHHGDRPPGQRAGGRVVLEVLRQLGALEEGELAVLSEFRPGPITNWRGLVVGHIRPCFRLERAG